MRLYRRADSEYWWCSFHIPGHSRFRASTKQPQKAAARLAANVIYQEKLNSAPSGDRWRLRHLTGTWLDAHARHRKDAATLTYQLDNLNRLIGADTWVDALAAADIIHYRARRRGEGVGPASVNRELSALRSAITFCQRHYGMKAPALYWRELFLPEPAKRLPIVQPDTDFPRLLAAADDEMKAMILLAVTTGLRRENVWQLDWRCVDLGQGIIALATKGSKMHSVRVVPQVVAALGRTPPAARTGPVFPTGNKRRRWEATRRAAGREDLHWHDLRHVFATWARHGGIDIADLRDAMNHASITTTMRYAHILPREKRTAFDAAAEVLGILDPAPATTTDTKVA